MYSPFTNSSQSSPLSFKECIRRFTPAWHALIMGTGAVTILFSIFPYGNSTTHHGLQLTALTLLICNTLLFLLLLTFTLLRYIPGLLFPRHQGLWRATLKHPTQSLFIGCAPMGFATILICATDVAYGYFGFGGGGFVWTLWALWWVDVLASVLVCFGQMHYMFTRQTHSLSSMTMAWLLPIVTLIVVSACGASIALSLLSLPSPSSTSSPAYTSVYLTLAVCTTLVTIGLTLALMITTIYVLRLVVYKLPTGPAVFSLFLPLGPFGQAGFTYVLLGELARRVFPISSSSSFSSEIEVEFSGESSSFIYNHAGDVLYILGWTLGFALWGFASCWVVLGFIALFDVLVLKKNKKQKKNFGSGSVVEGVGAGEAEAAEGKGAERLPFKVTFWGMIFPNGVYANLTIHLSTSSSPISSSSSSSPSTINPLWQVLRIWGTIYSVFTVLLFLFALVRTFATLRDGSVFEELCEGEVVAEDMEEETGEEKGEGKEEEEEQGEIDGGSDLAEARLDKSQGGCERSIHEV